MKRSFNSLVLTTILDGFGVSNGTFGRVMVTTGEERWVMFPSNTDLLSSGDLELAVGHLYRLSFVEEDSQSW